MSLTSLKPHAHHLDKRLRFRLRLYLLLTLILILILFFNIARGTLRVDFGIISLITGLILGALSARMFHISWDKNTNKVVSRLDMFGGAVLIVYIVLEIFRDKIVGFFTHGTEVTAVSFALFAGIMFGRVLGTRGKIIEILKKQRVFG